MGWFRPLGNASLLTFVPGEYQLRAIVTFKVPPSNETTVTETTVVTLQPPLVSLIWGGIVGSLLLAAFVGTYRLVREPRDKRVRLLVQILFLAGAGAVCAVIALILLRRLQGVELPVNVTVADFYGGVVIGLFSFKIGDWLYVRLFGEGQQKPDSAG